MDESRRLADGSLLAFERIYPLDAMFDTLDDAPADIRESKRYKDVGDFSIGGLAQTPRQRFRRTAARHPVPFARQRPRSEEAAARDESRRVSRRVECECVLAGLDGAATGPAHASRRQCLLTDLHGERARHSGLRRWHVVRQGGARERHARPRLRGRPQAWIARQHDLGRPVRVARGERDRHHLQDGAVLRGQLAAAAGARRGRGRIDRGVPRQSAGAVASRARPCTSTRDITRWAWPSRCRRERSSTAVEPSSAESHACALGGIRTAAGWAGALRRPAAGRARRLSPDDQRAA